ncbi:hypothetical protein BB561_006740 [Smittium simulii]|uniref:Uncharacterized protein n=1 Tax=Smittium simulii TaxID=133385 RepID=A0A2T9Y222_9FUNG|nr:hypothetical protein BB561_006740 [Smittium simulii]
MSNVPGVIPSAAAVVPLTPAKRTRLEYSTVAKSGRLSFLKCNPDQECHNYSDTNALCRKIVKPSCLIPGRKCVEGKNGYDQCVDGKSEFVECKADQKCIIVDKNFSSCVPRDNEQECEKGYDKCIDGLNGHALCYKGRLSFLKCNPDQECHNYSDTNALCRKIVKPSCLIPGRKCVEGKNGYDQCVDGKSEFVECKADQKCIIVDKNFSSCVPRDNEQECEKGYDKCIDGLNGHALCYKGRLSFLKCNPDQECHNYSDTNALYQTCTAQNDKKPTWINNQKRTSDPLDNLRSQNEYM